MTTAAADNPRSRCWRCEAVVLWRPLNGTPIALSKCQPGLGNVAIQTVLSGAEVAVAMPGSGWRRHDEICARKSFVGSAPPRKTR